MSIQLRILLIVGALVVLIAIVHKVRGSNIKIADTTFWVVLSAIILIIAIFPQIPYFFSDLLGITSPANFVFFCMFVILLVYAFHQTLKISELRSKLIQLSQDIALVRQKRQSEQEERTKE